MSEAARQQTRPDRTRRAEQRVPISRALRLDAPSRPMRYYATSQLARTLDLSAGGCLVRCTTPAPLGTDVDVSLRLADTVVTLRGRVVRAQPVRGLQMTAVGERAHYRCDGTWELALEFHADDEQTRDGLRAYLACFPAG